MDIESWLILLIPIAGRTKSLPPIVLNHDYDDCGVTIADQAGDRGTDR